MGVLLALMFIIGVIFISLLFAFYYSIMEEQIHLRNDVANIKDDLKKNSLPQGTQDNKTENLQAASCPDCPSGWVLIRSKCYYFQEKAETWERSHQDCAERNAILLVLNDRAELDSLLPRIGRERFWLGLRRNSSNIDEWLWADGSALTFSAWNEGEPNNDKNVEHCAEILGGQRSMNDRDCDNKIGYICESIWMC
ncbi:C-type lectin domain family 4 member G-like [Pyxicephalus adspersus]|uniref:C-type lectin domain family 4 member G-like n=1 Tax=Pyxicephalus adspersus TaxID=30357 RepID=UPI003B5A442C